MLFNSYPFLFQFLPVVLLVGWGLALWKPTAVKVWLTVGSFYFYAWWHAAHLPLLIAVMLFTYAVGKGIMRANRPLWRNVLLGIGLVGVLGVLGYFKYFNFFAGTVNSIVGATFRLDPILLPLAISFFTFQKVAFLVDVHQGKIQKVSFLDYCLFVAFFPQLIAGPIVHYREIVPQFARRGTFRFRLSHVSVGISMFAMGLFKKVVVADALAPIANPLFELAARGKVPTMADAWVGALAYSLQLYFDFSGYSDMAIGLARMFGISLPLNFNSPYKAADIIDFWRRWHITLSKFLRDYVYIPLGGNRCGRVRLFGNLFVTMLVGGLWHGAGWTFIAWGFIHGVFLAINHAWQKVPFHNLGVRYTAVLSWAVTFTGVVMAWVVFRAQSMPDAWRIVHSMVCAKKHALKQFDSGDVMLVAAVLVAGLVLPNTQQIFGQFRPAMGYVRSRARFWAWRPQLGWALIVGVAFGICICCLARPSQFLYFQF